MADFSGQAGLYEEGLELIGRSKESAWKHEDYGAANIADFIQAKLLIKVGRSAEAIPILFGLYEANPLQRAHQTLALAEALIELDDMTGANSAVREVYRIIEEYEFPHLKNDADALARRL